MFSRRRTGCSLEGGKGCSLERRQGERTGCSLEGGQVLTRRRTGLSREQETGIFLRGRGVTWRGHMTGVLPRG